MLAVPKDNYFSQPEFTSDGKQVVYSLGAATNGAYGGTVGIGRVSSDGNANEVLLLPEKRFELPVLVDSKFIFGDRLLVISASPISGGTYLADKYLYELRQISPVNTLLYSWGTNEIMRVPPMDAAFIGGSELVVYDHGWRSASGKTPAASENEDDDVVPASSPSPNGKFAVRAVDKTLVIEELLSGKKLRTFNVDLPLQGLAWAPNSKSFVVVVSHFKDDYNEVFDFDEMRYFRVEQ